jgi:tRNA pseudouridine38-40 synthase
MPRYRLLIEYDGRPYRGFQAQAGLPSVQDTLQRAIHGFSGEEPQIQVAGRTDTGVHATGQVAHVDFEREWKPDVVRDAVNAHLVPEPVCLVRVEEVSEDFHARFSAKERRYLYRILNRRAPPALDQGRVWHVKKPMDVATLNAAGQVLVGHHDFTTFRDAQCQAKSPMKTLDVVEAHAKGEEVQLVFASRSFLHRQVRSMVGSLAEVGAGRWSVEDLRDALHARDRKACGPVAPADGLYLTEVRY